MSMTTEILDQLTEAAKQSPRKRMNYDLRNSVNDLSQRMLNAMEPETRIPIHRHQQSSEVVTVIRGALKQNFYDSEGRLTQSFIVRAGDSCPIFVVPPFSWHNSESLESGTIIFEAKDGPFVPLGKEDVIE